MAAQTQGRPSTETVLARADRAQMAPLDRLRSDMTLHKAKIAAICPRGVEVDRVIQLAIASVGRDPKLLKCSGASLVIAVAQIAAVGLEPGTALQQAFLVPRNNRRKDPATGKWEDHYEATPQIGYRGFEVLASRAEGIKCKMQIVNHGDTWEYFDGFEPVLRHAPCENYEGEPVMRLGYLLWSYPDRRKDALVWTRQMFERHRDRFAPRSMYDSNGVRIPRVEDRPITGPWVEHFPAMCAKTLVRMAAKNWALNSAQIRDAMQIDKAGEAGRPEYTFVPGIPAEQAAHVAMALGEPRESVEGQFVGEEEREPEMAPVGRQPGDD